jgi:hypothetical protein
MLNIIISNNIYVKLMDIYFHKYSYLKKIRGITIVHALYGMIIVIPRILNMDINIYLLKSFYSFSPIKI